MKRASQAKWLLLCGLSLTALGCNEAEVLPAPLPSADEPEAEAVFSPGSMSAGLDYATSVVLEAPDGATRIGMLVDVRSENARALLETLIEVRGFAADGTPTEWLPAETTWSEENYLVARADVGFEIFGAQLRLPSDHLQDVANITFAAVIPQVTGETPSGKPQFDTEQAALSIPGFVKTRSQWNARNTKCSGSNTNKHRMAIHHTFTPPTSGGSYAARVRGIQAYHMDTRGWCDIGYHFLVTDDGSVYEGRPLRYNGAHVGGHNSGNIGISFVGCFQSGACDSMGTMHPSTAALDGAANTIREMSDQFGIAINNTKIKGHKQHSGASTSCPGDRLLAKFDTIFAKAKGGTTVVEPDPEPEPEPTGSTGRVVGVVWDVSVTNGPADPGAIRLPAANVSAGGKTIGVKGGNAYWELVLPVGTHTLTAVAPGYQAAARTVEVKAGKETWASLGLEPIAADIDEPKDGIVTVQILDSKGTPMSESAVHIHDVETKATNSNGMAGFPFKAATELTITAYAAGLQARTITHTVNGDELVQIALEAEVKDSWTGTVQGVIWDETVTTSPSASGAKRLSDALVLCSCGKARSARDKDGYWSFDLSGGSYTFTAVAPGYYADSKDVSVSWGGSEWGSIGLTPY